MACKYLAFYHPTQITIYRLLKTNYIFFKLLSGLLYMKIFRILYSSVLTHPVCPGNSLSHVSCDIKYLSA